MYLNFSLNMCNLATTRPIYQQQYGHIGMNEPTFVNGCCILLHGVCVSWLAEEEHPEQCREWVEEVHEWVCMFVSV